MDRLGLKRYCCRRMVMTHVDLIEKLLKYDIIYLNLIFAAWGIKILTYQQVHSRRTQREEDRDPAEEGRRVNNQRSMCILGVRQPLEDGAGVRCYWYRHIGSSSATLLLDAKRKRCSAFDCSFSGWFEATAG
jgi:hypothetical protein